MAESKKKKRGRFCVAGAPNQQSCKNNTFTPGVTTHQFPANPVLREKWVKFIQRHRHDFGEPSKYASLCSAHFEDLCYTSQLAMQLDDLSHRSMNRVLIREVPFQQEIRLLLLSWKHCPIDKNDRYGIIFCLIY